MARIHGKAGEWARIRGVVAGLWPLFLGIFAVGYSLATLMMVSFVWGALLVAVSATYMVWSLNRGLRHVERYFKGAYGEERVSGILQSLPDTYHVFNDFEAGKAHVDHVVAGPCGVFSIETKYWRGTVTLVDDGDILLDGRLPDRSPVQQALREAKSVRNYLESSGWKGEVTPILAFASDTFSNRRAEVKGIRVVNSYDLCSILVTDKTVMSANELERLVRIMENNGK